MVTGSIVAALAGGALAAATSAASRRAAAPRDTVVVAAGDIACDPSDGDFRGGDGTRTECRQRHTARLLEGATAVLALGDLQYENGAYSKFLQSYQRSWGAYKAITRPAPGNHDYEGSPTAAGYFQYWGRAAGTSGTGYYSFDLGSWHLIALNSQCNSAAVGGCDEGSPQERWLRADLARTTKPCILAYWHHPRVSSGMHGNHREVAAFWDALYAAHADISLTAHDHDYERFRPQSPAGEVVPLGLRAFVVGTGGRSLRPFEKLRANSVVRNANTFGVLKLTLRRGSYAWQFVRESGDSFADAGSGSCHRGPAVVRVASFQAVRARTGVTVGWRTAAEKRTAGFNLYRERAGRRVRLNRALIGAGRRTYSWRDPAVPARGARYRLEAVDRGGARTWIARATVAARRR